MYIYIYICIRVYIVDKFRCVYILYIFARYTHITYDIYHLLKKNLSGN